MPETLQPKEQPTQTPTEVSANFNTLDEQGIKSVITSRKALLESIKSQVSLKSYYFMEEKIVSEEKRLKEILDWRMGRSRQLSRYSLVLNPNYFEQEFM